MPTVTKFTCTPEHPYERDKPGFPMKDQAIHPIREVQHVGLTVTEEDCHHAGYGIDYSYACPNCGEQWTVDGPDY